MSLMDNINEKMDLNERIYHLTKKGKEYSNGKRDIEAKKCFKKAYNAAKEKHKEDRPKEFNYIAKSAYKAGYEDLCDKILAEAVDSIDEVDDRLKKANSVARIGSTYAEIGDVESSMQNLSLSLDYLNEFSYDWRKIEALIFICKEYYLLDEKKKAKNVFEEIKSDIKSTREKRKGWIKLSTENGRLSDIIYKISTSDQDSIPDFFLEKIRDTHELAEIFPEEDRVRQSKEMIKKVKERFSNSIKDFSSSVEKEKRLKILSDLKEEVQNLGSYWTASIGFSSVANCYLEEGEIEKARKAIRKAIEFLKRVESRWNKDLASNCLVVVSTNIAVMEGNVELLNESLDISKKIKDRWRRSICFSMVSRGYREVGNYGKAKKIIYEAYQISQEVDYQYRKVSTLRFISEVLFRLGEDDSGRDVLEIATRIMRDLDDELQAMAVEESREVFNTKYRSSMSSQDVWIRNSLKKIQIHPTLNCNLDCLFCEQTLDEADNIDKERWMQLADQIGNFNAKVTISGGGEPLTAFPSLLEMMKKFKEHETSFDIITNGSLLDKEKSRKLIDLNCAAVSFSIHGIGETDNYLKNKERSFEKAVKNIKDLNRLKRDKGSYRPEKGLKMVLTKQNVDEVSEVASLAHELDFNRFELRQVINKTSYSINEEQLPALREQIKKAKEILLESRTEMEVKFELEEIEELVADNASQECCGKDLECECESNQSSEEIEESDRYSPACLAPFTDMVVFADGRVAPCCNFYGSYNEKIVDNILEKSLNEIWTGEKFNRLREMMRRNILPEECKECGARDPELSFENKN